MGRMYQQQKTGVLEATSPDGVIKVHLMDGRVTDVENTDGSSWKLGEFLTESDTVAINDLVKAQRRAEKATTPAASRQEVAFLRSRALAAQQEATRWKRSYEELQAAAGRGGGGGAKRRRR